jgi:hypothetical protein
MKKRKSAAIVGMILAVIMIAAGFILKIPDAEISFFGSRENGGYEEYVGGDAYNFIIEAALRSGEIAGRTTAKTILICNGLILFMICWLALPVVEPPKDKEKSISPQIESPVYKECPECKNQVPINFSTCKECGYPFVEEGLNNGAN